MDSNQEKIPRIIHYCWFGGNEKPAKVKKCIASWKKYLTGYQFMEWNETSFDVNSNKYTKQAYIAKKYAFASDYVRLHALNLYGGIYMDTDVEVLKPLNRFLMHDSFWGFEDEHFVATSIMGVSKGHFFIKEFLEHYNNRDFIGPDGSCDTTTNVAIITNICVKHGLVANGKFQELSNGMVFYPRTYFSPYDYINCESFISGSSYTIHHFDKSWLPLHVRLKGKLKWIVSLLIGGSRIARLRKTVSLINLKR